MIHLFNFIMADKESHNQTIRTYKGEELIPVAIQENPRKINKKKTQTFYALPSKQAIYYNESGVFFIPIRRFKNAMTKYYKIMTMENDDLNEEQRNWLSRNSYKLLD